MSVRVLFFVLALLAVSCTTSEKKHTNGALEALQLQASQRIFPFTKLPRDAYFKAAQVLQQDFRQSKIELRSSRDWEAIGPWNTAGRALSVAVNPQDGETLFVGTASGGLWRSRKMGKDTSWRRIATGFPVTSVAAVSISPVDSNFMLIGTGEVYNNERSGTGAAYRSTRGLPGLGILKSNDAGRTWSLSLDWSLDQNTGIHAIEIHPKNDSLIVAATTEGVFISSDRGETWKRALDVPMAMDVGFHPTRQDWIVAGCGNFNSERKGIYLSRDQGKTWIQTDPDDISGFRGKIRIDHSMSSPDVVYAGIGDAFDPDDTELTWLLRSDNGGLSWDVVNTEDFASYQGWFAHDLAVHPEDDKRLTIVGIYAYQSNNAGQSMDRITIGTQVTQGRAPISGPDGSPRYMHVDFHDVEYHPGNPDVIIFANDGGVFVSEDGGQTFSSRNGGLQTTQFYNGISVAPYDSNLVFGGLQDNNSILYDGQLAWVRTLAGDGSWSSFHPQGNSLMGSLQFLNVYRSTNNGQDWTRVLTSAPGDQACFMSPAVRSNADPERLYACNSRVYRSDNDGRGWYRTNNGQSIFGNDPAFCLGTSFQDPDLLYCGLAPFSGESSVWKSSNGGNSWQRVGEGTFPNRYPTDIAFDPQNDLNVIITFGGFGTGHIFITEDGGVTWTDITTNLPDHPFNAICIDHEYEKVFYAGSDLSLFYTTNGGQSWEVWDQNLPEALVVYDLEIQEASRMLYLGSHGNGMYRRPLHQPISTASHHNRPDSFYLSPNPVTEPFISINSREVFDWEIERALIMQSNGQSLSVDIISDHIVELPIQLNSGVHYLIVDINRQKHIMPFIYLRQT